MLTTTSSLPGHLFPSQLNCGAYFFLKPHVKPFKGVDRERVARPWRSKWRSDELVSKVVLKVSDAEDGPFVDVQGGEMATGCVAFDDSTRALFLSTPTRARYVRIEALAWQHAVSLRAGVIVVRAEAPSTAAAAKVAATTDESKATAPTSLHQGVVVDPSESSRTYSSVHLSEDHGLSSMVSATAW